MSHQGGGQRRLNLGSAEGHRPTWLRFTPCLTLCLCCVAPVSAPLERDLHLHQNGNIVSSLGGVLMSRKSSFCLIV